MPVWAVFSVRWTLFFMFFRLFLDIRVFPTTTFLKIRASVLRKTRRIDPRTPEGPDP